MPNRVAQPRVGHDVPLGPSVGRPQRSGTKSSRHITALIAGAGILLAGLAAVASTGSVFAVSTVTFLGQSLLALWLPIRGYRLTRDHTPFDTASTSVVTT